MKISSLISLLEKIKDSQGDIDVTMRSDYSEWFEIEDVYVSCNGVVLDSEGRLKE